MRCYYVLVHGKLRWHPENRADDKIGAERPAGFYCHRYLLAANETSAKVRAFRRVSDNLDREFGWITSGIASVDLEVETISTASMRKVIKRENKGHSFYADE